MDNVVYMSPPSAVSFEDAEITFTEMILPVIRAKYEDDGIPDWPARREAWCNFIDHMNKINLVTDQNANDWPHPQCNLKPDEGGA